MSTFPLRVAIGTDHAGFPLKKRIQDKFGPLVDELIDCGTHSEESVDFPDFTVAVARRVLDGHADRGILLCGSGVGVSMAANKFAGIRASVCHDHYSAHQGVEHDDMNVLCLGGRVIGDEPALEIVAAFLGARFDGSEKSQRRLNKVLEIERKEIGAAR